jgi:hypothetical protein
MHEKKPEMNSHFLALVLHDRVLPPYDLPAGELWKVYATIWRTFESYWFKSLSNGEVL